MAFHFLHNIATTPLIMWSSYILDLLAHSHFLLHCSALFAGSSAHAQLYSAADRRQASGRGPSPLLFLTHATGLPLFKQFSCGLFLEFVAAIMTDRDRTASAFEGARTLHPLVVGHMCKQGKRNFAFSKRYFALYEGGLLAYYDHERDYLNDVKKHNGVVSLLNSYV